MSKKYILDTSQYFTWRAVLLKNPIFRKDILYIAYNNTTVFIEYARAQGLQEEYINKIVKKYNHR